MSVRDEFDKNGLLSSGGEVPLSWWFLDREVSELARSIESISLGCAKSAVGRAIVSISSSETSCINYSSWMWPASYGMLDKIVGKFPGDSTYFEFLSLSTELAADVTSPSGSVGNMGVMDGPYVTHAQF